MLSTNQPVDATLLSLAARHLMLTKFPVAEGGSTTPVVTNPPESPLHAALPAMGLPKLLLIVEL